MSTREDILGRVRAQLNRNPDNAVAGRAAIEATLAAKQQGPRPAVDAEKSALAGRRKSWSVPYLLRLSGMAWIIPAPTDPRSSTGNLI